MIASICIATSCSPETLSSPFIRTESLSYCGETTYEREGFSSMGLARVVHYKATDGNGKRQMGRQ